MNDTLSRELANAYGPEHLDALRDLVNLHIGAAVPGWWVPSALIAARLERNLVPFDALGWQDALGQFWATSPGELT